MVADIDHIAIRQPMGGDAFLVDNIAPVVGAIRVAPVRNSNGHRVACTVSDNLSPVRSAEYSINAGTWITVFPADGIFDSLSENLEFVVEGLEKGEHTLVVKALDYFGNVGAGKTTFIVK